jgi:hypothetical protein
MKVSPTEVDLASTKIEERHPHNSRFDPYRSA